MLQCIAVCCIVLQCVLLVRSKWSSERISENFYIQYCLCAHNSVLQCVAVCCSVLQCVAVCCIVLQCVAVCCFVFYWYVVNGVANGLLRISGYDIVYKHTTVCCSVLQCVAVCCSVLQCVAELFICT